VATKCGPASTDPKSDGGFAFGAGTRSQCPVPAEQRGSLTTRSQRERPALRSSEGWAGGSVVYKCRVSRSQGSLPCAEPKGGILSLTRNAVYGTRNRFLFKILPASHCSSRIKTKFPSNGMIPVDRGGGGSHQQSDFLPRFSTRSECTLDAPLRFAQGRGADEASAPTRSLEPQG
jgi:hypothetical protein